jgi:hypothetical protein
LQEVYNEKLRTVTPEYEQYNGFLSTLTERYDTEKRHGRLSDENYKKLMDGLQNTETIIRQFEEEGIKANKKKEIKIRAELKIQEIEQQFLAYDEDLVNAFINVKHFLRSRHLSTFGKDTSDRYGTKLEFFKMIDQLGNNISKDRDASWKAGIEAELKRCENVYTEKLKLEKEKE